jgi:hypothetical protein
MDLKNWKKKKKDFYLLTGPHPSPQPSFSACCGSPLTPAPRAPSSPLGPSRAQQAGPSRARPLPPLCVADRWDPFVSVIVHLPFFFLWLSNREPHLPSSSDSIGRLESPSFP